jgi:hypothetical protein
MAKEGHLFPPTKSTAVIKHVSKDVIAKKIRAVRDVFIEKYARKCPELATGKTIKSHSGRRHAISHIAASAVPDNIGMAWAQIASHAVYAKYVDLTPDQVASQMSKLDRKHPFGASGLSASARRR